MAEKASDNTHDAEDNYEPFSIEKLASLFPDGTAKDQWSFGRLIPLIRKMIPAIASDLENVQKYPVYHEDLNGLITKSKCIDTQVPALISPIVQENQRLKAKLSSLEAQVKELQERQKKYDDISMSLQVLRDEINAVKTAQPVPSTSTVDVGRLVLQPSGFRSVAETPAKTPVEQPSTTDSPHEPNTTPDMKVPQTRFDTTPRDASNSKAPWATVAKKGKVVRGTREKTTSASEDIVMSALQIRRAPKVEKEKVKKNFCLHGIPPREQTEHETLDEYSKDLKAIIESIGISVRFVSIYSAKNGRQTQEFLDMDAAELKQLIVSDELKAEKEEQVADAVVRCLDHSLQQRSRYAVKLVRCIRVSLLTAEYMASLPGTLVGQHVQQAVFSRANDAHRHRSSYQPVIVFLWGCNQQTNRAGQSNAVGLYCLDPLTGQQWSVPCAVPPSSWSGPLVYMVKDGQLRIYVLVYLGGPTSCRLLFYETGVDRWTRVGTFFVRHAWLTAIDERLYMLGGERELCAFDEELRQITVKGKMPAMLYGCASVASYGRLYLFGGKGWSAHDSLYLPTMMAYRYDPEPDRWEELAPMPTARSHAEHVSARMGLFMLWAGVRRSTLMKP
ncbi:kelch repeat and BTB domain-containing protein 8-like [Paramacrobiotus metropolitanus]|uniref:kelch repeat and BTB domain-containing protein 8-like n=1 Tax=Paramacrobiotus metropolitanus TaxID=2943436 RepID=UPI002445E6A1|nr:kelch repeat and BTB domain-containing protein 8-like [Paramacrobiotus metropolitanus]XP_055351428.1 kelch repeat and BTB domain-containing protein 8-like [Paramacrobiotus metropolitanus]